MFSKLSWVRWLDRIQQAPRQHQTPISVLALFLWLDVLSNDNHFTMCTGCFCHATSTKIKWPREISLLEHKTVTFLSPLNKIPCTTYTLIPISQKFKRCRILFSFPEHETPVVNPQIARWTTNYFRLIFLQWMDGWMARWVSGLDLCWTRRVEWREEQEYIKAKPYLFNKWENLQIWICRYELVGKSQDVLICPPYTDTLLLSVHI